MKKHHIISCAAIALTMTACSEPIADLREVDSFAQAKPVWAEGRETERNLTLQFRKEFSSYFASTAYVKMTASCDYRLKVNGQFVSHGPAVAAHDFYRVDCYDIKPYLDFGTNIVTLEVAGYNDDNYYLLNQPSFLQAEIEVDGKVVGATGNDFVAYDLKQRKQDVQKFSFQRPHIEQYTLSSDFEAWTTQEGWAGAEPIVLAEQPEKQLLSRHVPYPDFRIHEAESIADNMYSFECNSSGFLGVQLNVTEAATVRFAFDEILSGKDQNGRPIITPTRQGSYRYIIYDLEPGSYTLESFEPYTMKYMEVLVDKGSCQVERVYMRDYCGSGIERATFESDNAETNELFKAARETYRQNAVDIFMDCPSRERAGWLCDSYFTGRASFDFTGETRVEKNFLENFLLPKEFKHIDKGMLPMCYPSEHPNQNHIPNWAMWFVLELEEYLHRSGDRELVDRAKGRVYDLVNYFKPFENEDGLLEKLTRWVFVEWSNASQFVQDVNYPTNMLYAKMLEVIGRLYDDPALIKQAQQVRQTIVAQSFDGEFFVDNAIRGKDGKLQVTRNRSETCQYYALYLETATPESHPELWNKMLNEFGPIRQKNNAYPEIHPSNAFIGNFLRMEILSRAERPKQILDENKEYYVPMARQTGTLWENMTSEASCNHGFASHMAHTFYRDVLGVYDIAPMEKKVTFKFMNSGIAHCKGTIPVGNEAVDVEWTLKDGKMDVTLKVPAGYTYEYTSPGIESCTVTEKK